MNPSPSRLQFSTLKTSSLWRLEREAGMGPSIPVLNRAMDFRSTRLPISVGNPPTMSSLLYSQNMVSFDSFPTSVGISPHILFSLSVSFSRLARFPISAEIIPSRRLSSRKSVLNDVMSYRCGGISPRSLFRCTSRCSSDFSAETSGGSHPSSLLSTSLRAITVLPFCSLRRSRASSSSSSIAFAQSTPCHSQTSLELAQFVLSRQFLPSRTE
mmetsp:Transcript_49113/g.104444  ORF Transcript_49113/g.104444 Transcript_49113/m.104444 type:complete len:213 (+) Transcript_49113:1327-1965(+)